MSWPAFVTQRWSDGIIDVVDALDVDYEGRMTAKTADGQEVRIHSEFWFKTRQEAVADCNRRRALNVENLREHIERVERLTFRFSDQPVSEPN
jgi:hypothetical protein